MKASKLAEYLRSEPSVEVLIHDASTGDDLPIGRVQMTYGRPIVLHVQGDDEDGGE